MSPLANSRTNVAFEFGEGVGPALPGLDDLAGALDATVSSLLVVHGVGSQDVLSLAPVLFVVCGDCGLCDIDYIRHDNAPL